MSERVAAKGLIVCEDNKYLFVAGQRGMWNLVGGGIRKGKGNRPDETPKMAFLREADEEIENLTEYINLSDLTGTFPLSGPTISRDGLRQLTHWLVFQTSLLIPYSELKIAENSEITAMGVFSREECTTHPNMSDLAKQAITRVMV